MPVIDAPDFGLILNRKIQISPKDIAFVLSGKIRIEHIEEDSCVGSLTILDSKICWIKKECWIYFSILFFNPFGISLLVSVIDNIIIGIIRCRAYDYANHSTNFPGWL